MTPRQSAKRRRSAPHGGRLAAAAGHATPGRRGGRPRGHRKTVPVMAFVMAGAVLVATFLACRHAGLTSILVRSPVPATVVAPARTFTVNGATVTVGNIHRGTPYGVDTVTAVITIAEPAGRPDTVITFDLGTRGVRSQPVAHPTSALTCDRQADNSERCAGKVGPTGMTLTEVWALPHSDDGAALQLEIAVNGTPTPAIAIDCRNRNMPCQLAP